MNRAGASTVINPVIPGFHPDPSVCRVGDDYWLGCSSFEYVPGVPIFHSRDLVTWSQVGNALDRPSQPNLGAARPSGGVYAPTLRYHDGGFWLVTTKVSDHRGHLIVTADDPAGPWSDPVIVEGLRGIDPDLATEAADVFAAIASVSGPFLGSPESVTPTEPVSVIAFLGLANQATPIDMEDGPELWRTALDCQAGEPTWVDQDQQVSLTEAACGDGSDAHEYRVEGMTHVWPRYFAAHARG
jgi:hypothetical protein